MKGVLNEVARFISAPGAEAIKALLSSKGQISVSLGAVTREDGTALTKQATTVAGYAQLSDKETVINIPAGCTAGEELGFVVQEKLIFKPEKLDPNFEYKYDAPFEELFFDPAPGVHI